MSQMSEMLLSPWENAIRLQNIKMLKLLVGYIYVSSEP